MASKVHVPDDRYFGPDPRQKEIAQRLYQTVANLPLICPHGHVDPRMFADPDYSLGTPTDLLIIPDHYVFRMLYSQGIPMESLGLAAEGRRSGGDRPSQDLADVRGALLSVPRHPHRHVAEPRVAVRLRRGREALRGVGAADLRPDRRQAGLARVPAAGPLRAVQHRGDVHHRLRPPTRWCTIRRIRASGWKGRIVPCFRPDGVVNIDAPNWRKNIEALGAVSGIEVTSYQDAASQALENRRAFFKSLGATSTDHAAMTAHTEEPRRARGGGDLPAGAERPGHRRGRHAIHGPHAHGDGPDEHRGRPGDAAPRRLVPESQPAALRALRDRHGGGYPDRQRVHPQPAPAARQVRQRDAPDPDPVQPGRVHLLARAGPAGRPLPRAAAGAALVVLRQPERHGARSASW